MAATIGYYNKDGFPRKHLRAHICAVCNQATSLPVGSLVEPDPTVIHEPVHQLECKHVFHEKCIRGWCLIGKKEICPYWYVILGYMYLCVTESERKEFGFPGAAVISRIYIFNP